MKTTLLVNLLTIAAFGVSLSSCQKDKKKAPAATPATAPKSIIARVAKDQTSSNSSNKEVKVDLVASNESLKNADATTVERAFNQGSPMNLEGEGKGVKALTDETGHAFALNGCQGYNAPIGNFHPYQNNVGIGAYNHNPVLRFLSVFINVRINIDVYFTRMFMPVGFPYAQGGQQTGCGYSNPYYGSQPQYYTQPYAQQNPQHYYNQYYQPYNPPYGQPVQPEYIPQPQPGVPQPGNNQPTPIPPVPGQAVNGQPPFTPVVYSQNIPGQPYTPGNGPTPYPFMNQYQQGNYTYYTYGAQNINPQGSNQVVVPGQGLPNAGTPSGPTGPNTPTGPQPVPPQYQQPNNGTTPGTYPQTGYPTYTYNPGTGQYTYGSYTPSN